MLRAREPVFPWKKKTTTIYPIESSHSEIYKDRVNVVSTGHVVFIYLEIYSFFFKEKDNNVRKSKGAPSTRLKGRKRKGI